MAPAIVQGPVFKDDDDDESGLPTNATIRWAGVDFKECKAVAQRERLWTADDGARNSNESADLLDI